MGDEDECECECAGVQVRGRGRARAMSGSAASMRRRSSASQRWIIGVNVQMAASMRASTTAPTSSLRARTLHQLTIVHRPLTIVQVHCFPYLLNLSGRSSVYCTAHILLYTEFCRNYRELLSLQGYSGGAEPTA